MLVHLAQNLNPSIVQSPKSEPFVVITHENQWEDAAYLLLKKDAFVAQVWVSRSLLFTLTDRNNLEPILQYSAKAFSIIHKAKSV